MVPPTVHEVLELKQQIRAEASARREKQPEIDRYSRHIFQRIRDLPEYGRARTVMFYLDIRSEVRTQWFLPTAWAAGKQTVVPYCENGDIELFRLESIEELAPGAMGVLEPKRELRHRNDREVNPTRIDLVVMPGLAFDRQGGRLGYGKGYYDRFLHQLRPDALKLAVCFECQLFPQIPLLDHDIRVDMLVTEEKIYRVERQE